MGAPVTLISGFGRCGSSLTMQMLDAGGYPTTGRYPAFEPPETNVITFDAEWLRDQAGRAVKWCDPHYGDRNLLPGDYRSIWLDRDLKEQAKSHVKFGSLFGIPFNDEMLPALRHGYRKDRPAALRKLTANGPVMYMRFEHILHNPRAAAERLLDFVGGINVEAAAAVVRERGPECFDGMLELELIDELNISEGGSGTAREAPSV